MQCNWSNAINAINAIQCNDINAMQWMQCNECNAMNAMLWMQCYGCNVNMISKYPNIPVYWYHRTTISPYP